MKNKSINKTAGFTLIETLVAIGIFAFSITGLISVTARGVFDTNFVKNKFTAGYLALEGAEMIRSIRDTAAIQNIPWSTMMGSDQYLRDCVRGDTEACMIDPWTDSISVISCPQSICPALTYNQGNGRFSYEGQDNSTTFASIFNRTIYIEILNDHEATVTSEVAWNQGTRPHSVVFTYTLLDWAGP